MIIIPALWIRRLGRLREIEQFFPKLDGANVIQARPEPFPTVMNARSPRALHSLHRPPHHLFYIRDRPPLPSPALEEVGVEGGEQEARGDDGQHVFYEEQACQPPNQLHIVWLMEH